MRGDLGQAGAFAVRVVVDDPAVECAVVLALEHAGCPISDANGWIVSDGLPADVLVVHAQPWPCRFALGALSRRAVKMVVTLDSLLTFGPALAAALSGCSVVADSALTAAAELDGVSARSLEILSELAAGASNPDIARRLHVSVPTVKRELVSMQRAFGVRDRSGLVARAHAMGFQRFDYVSA